MARSKHNLTMHIVEDHNEVLEPIYRAIGSKRLAFSGNTMLHFDSHPDLLIPSDLMADNIFDRQEVERMTSIENWIMPLVYAGHISTVVWIKKEWATQIADGEYVFMLGKDSASGYMRCSCGEPYFVSELLYCPADQLENAKEIKLIVITYKSVEISLSSIADVLAGLNKESDIILDIDFDYFSTRNPFSEIYSKSQLGCFFTLYKFTEESTPETSTPKRVQQLDYLRKAMKLVVNKKMGGDDYQDDDCRVELIESLVDEEISQRGSADAGLLHEHGCTFDTSGLPHHVSTLPQITGYISDMFRLLSNLKVQPKVITAARSSDDDYCPKDQVDLIEKEVITTLQTLYTDLDVKKHYLDTNS
ncbi:UPF0489 protein C5orf22 homolog [Watersipora subatra]|uniref:UPF0489 protein C5orf22 homolog n=1 Tax=Watersipora subatra TaxID=2589382 RepID=UPI00355BA458